MAATAEYDLFIRGIQVFKDRIGKDSYLQNIPALKKLDKFSFKSPVTFFCGENGSGKSTLMEAIAVSYGFNPEGGTKNYSFSTFDTHSELCDSLGLIRGIKKPKWGYFLRAESYYNVATAEHEYGQAPGGQPQFLHERSHGESLLYTAQSNFRPESLFLLDEPEAALSPQRQLTLLYEIHRCMKEGSQFIIATHSPILLGLPGADILSFDGELHFISYEETDSYQVMKTFINNRSLMLKRLLGED